MMLLRLAVVTACLAVSSTGCDRTSPTPQATARRHENAALKYLRAYAALHQSATMPLPALADTYQAVPLEPPIENLIAAAAPALAELHHGAALASCDWHVSYEDGPSADTAHRRAARELIAVAGLRARLLFRDGHPARAVDDLLAATTVARHLSLDGSLASPLIAHALESGVMNVLARHLPEVPASDLRRVAERLDALPAGMTFAAALLSHEAISRGLLVGQVRTVRDDQLLARLNGLPMLAGRAHEVVDGCGGTPDGVVKCVEVLQAPYRRWAGNVSLPPDQFQQQYDTEAVPLASNPIFRLLTPSVPRIRWSYAYYDTRRALVRAAVAVQAGGLGALERHVDPYDGRQFSHAGTPGGFSLRSRLLQDEQPLSIVVGSAP